MTLLRDDNVNKEEVKRNLSRIFSELENIESSLTIKMSKWLHKKSKYYKKYYTEKGFGNVPKNLSKGDIIRVDFGINIGDEFSDRSRLPFFFNLGKKWLFVCYNTTYKNC